MVPLYIVFGTLTCMLFIYAGSIGWKVIDPFAPSVTRPTGPGGHYHK